VPAPSAPPVEAVASLFAIERTRLLHLLRELSGSAWRAPTACPDWTVLGLACHLLGDDLGSLSRRRDDYMGTPSPVDLSEHEFIDWLDDLQAEWVRAARRLSPQLVVELLDWCGPRLTAALALEDPTQMTSHVSWAGPEPSPIWLDQLRELSEYWIHRQQLLEATGRPSDLDPALLRPILLGLRWAYPYRFSLADFRPGDAVRIRIGQPLDDEWLLVFDGAEWRFSEERGGSIIATADFSADQGWRLLTNNIVEPVSALDVSGDARAVSIITTTRAIIGHPR
jgi:uncharacterized protein (TIGR03083 family)